MSSAGAAAADCATPCSPKAFPAQFNNSEIFETSIATAERLPIQSKALSGVTVPHHLLAADLIARTLRMVDRDAVRKIVILFPDHFKRTRLPFATTRRDFQTVFGLVRTDDEDADKLLAVPELVEELALFAHDHGIGAILPFIGHYFPGVPIIPIAVSIRSHHADWDKLAAELTPIIDPSTLIIQSTDFSHYLPLDEATQRDQESLNVISAGDLDAAARLLQPQNTELFAARNTFSSSCNGPSFMPTRSFCSTRIRKPIRTSSSREPRATSLKSTNQRPRTKSGATTTTRKYFASLETLFSAETSRASSRMSTPLAACRELSGRPQ